jgi:hypothetical protein
VEVVLAVLVLIAAGIAYGLFLRWVASAANRKGYSYWAVGLFTLFFPLLGLVLALLVPERPVGRRAPLRS